ncbi:hypothetical protein ECP02994385_3046 [Escherichia coli P0299438.5]|nr:hypothetical protein ECP029943811_3039 [Escherichia coli P0299438.11]ENB97992.1 hypothetical protein ECP02994383_3110 [Escherichia coli P0299438.3]ENC09630.1 hypothetical protein ECP02994385_3046 [Escherichia coli P0299438.5]ENC15005.1 hypothetical protein ECP02994386_3027 [Escherichia coli P0299438.6]ENC16413.1 hypothetical protein ECP02994387_3120 [Escherichia coli P0299438.7]ENC23735.1 hypothetical protein ECP02994388_3051 [Escherichia coli P0299438.8]
MFPAPAGINRQWSRREFTHDCVPRASGDKPKKQWYYRPAEQCSPRQRG